MALAFCYGAGKGKGMAGKDAWLDVRVSVARGGVTVTWASHGRYRGTIVAGLRQTDTGVPSPTASLPAAFWKEVLAVVQTDLDKLLADGS